MKRILAYSLTLALAAGATTGCQKLGASSVALGRGQFNEAIQRTNAEQMLLNIVRLHYRDSPYFMQVASVSTGLEMEVGLGDGFIGSWPSGGSSSYEGGFTASYKEKPTVTYTPLQGEQFVKQLLTPIGEDKIVLLLNSGWSISRTFLVLLQEMNGLQNAPTASGPTPQNEPDFRDFRRAVVLLRDLELRSEVEMGYAAEADGGVQLILNFKPKSKGTSEREEFCRLLGIDSSRDSFPVGPEVGANRITIIPRSLIASFFYLSQAVEAPERDLEDGVVTVTKTQAGEPFDWQQVTSGLMRIQSSTARRGPSDAHVRVRYRGAWFYVADNDLSSKSTFLLLEQLFSLQAGDTKAVAPVLTLPVSQ